jgi:hypothetical protein
VTFAVLVGPVAASAQTDSVASMRVQQVTVSADASLTGRSTVPVEVSYRLTGPGLASGIGLRTLPLAGRAVTVLTAGPAGARIGLATDAAGMVRGVVPVIGSESTGEGATSLRLGYGVEGAWAADGDRFDLLLPLVTVEAVPPEARPGLVELSVRLPAGSRVLEVFPSTLRAVDADAGVVLTGRLSVIPALVRVRGRTAGLPFGGVRTAEFAVLVLIAGLGILGWRHLSRNV